jgi:hypothetical protein
MSVMRYLCCCIAKKLWSERAQTIDQLCGSKQKQKDRNEVYFFVAAALPPPF